MSDHLPLDPHYVSGTQIPPCNIASNRLSNRKVMQNPIIFIRPDEATGEIRPLLAENGQWYVIAEESDVDVDENGFPQEVTFTAFIKLGKDEEKAKTLLPKVEKSVRTKTIVRQRTSTPTYDGQPMVMGQDENGAWKRPMGYYHTEKLRPFNGVHFQLEDLREQTTSAPVAVATASAEEPAF